MPKKVKQKVKPKPIRKVKGPKPGEKWPRKSASWFQRVLGALRTGKRTWD